MFNEGKAPQGARFGVAPNHIALYNGAEGT